MTPWLDDGDLRLYHGDALETVRQLPDESVDCVVTSPPYWGLRDYGTGEWEGGDPDCDHKAPPTGGPNPERYTSGGGEMFRSANDKLYTGECGKCGARRVDRQMGLEETPDLFVAGMVELFREIRRVLAPHGTCWVNLGDSYATGGNPDTPSPKQRSNHGSLGTLRSVPPAGLKQKDLCGIPWRVAFALQADGWWLRSDIIWAKPNPMPESVTDRPTKAHEYVFLMTKQPRYWFDTEAVREPNVKVGTEGHLRSGNGNRHPNHAGVAGKTVGRQRDFEQEGRQVGHHGRVTNEAGRNVRSVWQIATQPYPEAHFATFPEELARRCILAGCPIRVCRVCGKPSERIVDVQQEVLSGSKGRATQKVNDHNWDGVHARTRKLVDTVGWSDCGHGDWRTGVVLDPFMGSGTTAKVARDHQRHTIGIDLNADYLALAARRLQQLSLLTGDAA